MVEFTDRQGKSWRVWAVYPTLRQTPMSFEAQSGAQADGAAYVNPAFASGWLCFDCGKERRRFASVPPDWEHWDSDALEELCTRATPSSGVTEIR
jgi:hypothetical protein